MPFAEPILPLSEKLYPDPVGATPVSVAAAVEGAAFGGRVEALRPLVGAARGSSDQGRVNGKTMATFVDERLAAAPSPNNINAYISEPLATGNALLPPHVFNGLTNLVPFVRFTNPVDTLPGDIRFYYNPYRSNLFAELQSWAFVPRPEL